MLKDKILELFRDYEPEVRVVISRVLEEEWARLSYKQGARLEEIRGIIDSEVKRITDIEVET